ncbi:MAG: hypothetical protein E7179_02005 [Erysipelotrichaceae bacterium]|nr:hypothetical protein [Erysipelotrichaceae bacterium]
MASKAKLKSVHLKALACVYELDERGVVASSSGVLSVLKGKEEASSYVDLVTYDCLRSLSGRGGKFAIAYLLRNGYLDRRYSKQEDEDYLLLTEAGEDLAKLYLAHPRKKATGERKSKALFISKESLR